MILYSDYQHVVCWAGEERVV